MDDLKCACAGVEAQEVLYFHYIVDIYCITLHFKKTLFRYNQRA